MTFPPIRQGARDDDHYSGKTATVTTRNSPITVWQMSIMTIITIAGLRGLPAMAVMGWESIILYLLPAVMFFVPT
jgi:hypothetical protein